MGFSEMVNRMPKWAAVSVSGLALLVVAVSYFTVFHKPAIAGMGDTVPLICIDGNCKRVEWVVNQRIYDERTLDEFSANTPGVKCPGCGKNSLAFAWKCPTDGEVFLKRKPKKDPQFATLTEFGGKCPKCSFDPVAAENERIAKVLKQGR